MNCIQKADVYRLVGRSELPEAEKFQDWIYEEVLPSIDKKGGYVLGVVLFMRMRVIALAAG